MIAGRVLGALLGAAVSAQVVVSPAGLDRVEGNGVLPGLVGGWRLLQVHSDLGPAPMQIRKISFRQDGGTGTFTGTRVVDMELWAGASVPYDRMRLAFAANYVIPPWNPIVRRRLNLGPQGAQGLPSTFQGMDLPFDVPVVYIPTFSFAWEARVFAVFAQGDWNSADVQRCSHSGTIVPEWYGTGCNGLRQSLDVADNAGTLGVCYRCWGAPPNQPAVLALGTRNPELSLPGLCSPLLTDLLVLLPLGSTSATGQIDVDGPGTFFTTNTIPGAVVHSQFHVLDPGQPGIPVRNSDGRKFQAPVPNLQTVVRVSMLQAELPNDRAQFVYYGIIGHAFVTQFGL